MTQDACLSIAHHLCVYVLIATLVAEAVLLRGSCSAESVRRLARIDLAFGLAAVAVITAGVCRVLWGAKGSAFYTSNPVFWTKMALFAVIGLVSIVPTIRYIVWARELRNRSDALPQPDAWIGVRRLVYVELALLVFIPICAALMARGIGLS
jgi:putative membrane protein